MKDNPGNSKTKEPGHHKVELLAIQNTFGESQKLFEGLPKPENMMTITFESRLYELL